jgi:hypothetical protein
VRYFSDDYEVANPITAKEGKIRQLKWRLDDEDVDEDTKKMV